MAHLGHFRRECICGILITQCRCPDTDKQIEIITPCTHETQPYIGKHRPAKP